MKTLKMMLAGTLAFALVACSSSTPETTPEPTDSTEPTDSPEPPAVIENTEPTYSDGLYEGYIGTVMPTAWFEFTVTDAMLTDTYKDTTAAEGYDLLVTGIRLKNTFGQSIPMYWSDLQAQWFDPADDAFALPAAVYVGDTLEDEEFMLGINQTHEAKWVFEVPEGNNDYSISFWEYYESGDYGDMFFVYFTVK